MSSFCLVPANDVICCRRVDGRRLAAGLDYGMHAADYDALMLPATSQAFGPIIAIIGKLKNTKVLEMASGTGHLAQRLADQGANVVAIDFALK